MAIDVGLLIFWLRQSINPQSEQIYLACAPCLLNARARRIGGGDVDRLLFTGVALVCLAGCSTLDGGGSVSRINWSGDTMAGTITVSDPKLFRREALINSGAKGSSGSKSLSTKANKKPLSPNF